MRDEIGALVALGDGRDRGESGERKEQGQREEQRGYDKRGMPTKELLAKLGLEGEAAETEKYARLS